MDLSIVVNFLFKGLEISGPIAFAALGAVFCERSGVINIALEGFMAVTAFTIVWGSIAFQSIWMGLLVAIITGVIMSLIHAVATITYKVNQIVSGVAINIMAIGIGRFLSQNIFNQETQSQLNPYLFPTIFHKWINGMTGGRGFIALAAMIFGRWHPVGAVLAALLFGYADTFRIMFETKIPIPSQFVQMLPYVLAILVLVGMMGKAKPPAADGIPYEPGE
jgi:ABC-type uncharacterized transport system permease subunit